MKTNNILLVSTILASAAVLGLSPAASAQSDSPKTTSPAKQAKPAPKSHKVWTDDELGTLRPPADARVEPAVPANAPEQAATANQTTASKPAQKAGAPPSLTNPKSLQDADQMIAWENRDIDAQEEFLEKVKQEIADAPADQKPRLTKLLQERTQILAGTRNELQNLQAKKKDLAKPAPATFASSDEPPSQ